MTDETSSAKCARCEKPLTLTRAGTLRKGKRFCSSSCQQAAIVDARAAARRDLHETIRELEQVPAAAELVSRLKTSLQTLGFSPNPNPPTNP